MDDDEDKIPINFQVPIRESAGEENTYIYMFQCNLWKSNNASNELGLHLNQVMTQFTYKSQYEAGIVIKGKPNMTDGYKRRLKNVGIIVDDHDRITYKPNEVERRKYKASYKKAQAKLAKENLKNASQMEVIQRAARNKPKQNISIPTSLRAMSQKYAIGEEGSIPTLDPSKPFAFICGLQEPYFNYKKVPGLKGHTMIIDSSVEQPRAAIFHSRCLNIWAVPEFINRDMCTGLFLLPNKTKVYIVSLYLPSDVSTEDMIPGDLERLLGQVKREKAEILIMADTNAWSQALWNSVKTNDRGAVMEDMVMRHNLRVLNKGRRFTYIRYNAQSTIDATLASPGLVGQVEHWKVNDALCYSDHCSIQFILKVKHLKTELKFNLRKGNWGKFSFLMEEKSCPLLNPNLPTNAVEIGTHGLQRGLDQMYENIYQALEESCPKCPVRQTIPGLDWYNKDLYELKTKVRKIKDYVKDRAFKRVKQNDPKFDSSSPKYSEEDHKKARNKYRNECRKASKKQYRSNLSKKQSPKDVAALKRGLTKAIMPEVGILNLNGRPLAPIDSIKLLTKTHLPGCKDRPRKDARTKRSVRVRFDDPRAKHITAKKIKKAFQSFMPFKSPGPDLLPPIVLQQLGEMAIDRLMRIYKASFLLNFIPSQWLDIRMVFIPKSGKKSYSEPRSYRPISLMCFLYKTIEKLNNWVNEDKVLTKCPLHPKQHGFRKGFSCCSALTSLVGRVEYAIINRGSLGFALVVFLDIQGAYDNLSNGAIVRALRARGCSEDYINWSLDFLKFRRVIVDHKGVKVTAFPRKGAPQGAVSSPYFWSDAHDSFLKLFDNDPHVGVECYADDCALIVLGNDLEVMRGHMQKAIDKCEGWAARHGLTFAADKSEAMIFTRKQVRSPKRPNGWVNPKKLKVNNTEIKYSNLAKYLGVWLDPKLTFKAHIKSKVALAKGVLCKIGSAMGKFWGISPQMALWVWLGIVRPMITHGVIVWGHVTDNKWAQDLLNSVQRLAFKLITFFRKSTPTRGLEVILNVIPLDLHIKYLQATSFLRTKGQQVYNDNQMYTDVDCLKGHRQLTEEWLYRINCNAHYVTMTEVDDIIRRFIWEGEFHVDMSSLRLNPENPSNYGVPNLILTMQSSPMGQ